MVNKSFKHMILILTFIIYILSTVIIFLVFSNFYIGNIKKNFINENKYAGKVAQEYLENEKKIIATDARKISRNIAVRVAVYKKLDIFSNEFNVINNRLSLHEMDRWLYIRLLEHLKSELNSDFRGTEKNIEIFDKNFKTVNGIYNYNTGKEPYLLERKKANDSFILSGEEGLVELSKNEIYFKGIEDITRGPITGSKDLVGGVVIVSHKLNSTVLEAIKKLVNREIIIIRDDRVYLSTLYNENFGIQNNSIFKVRENKNDNYTEIQVSGKKMAFNFYPILDYSQKRIGYIGTGFYLSPLENMVERSFSTFLVLTVSFSIILMLILFMMLNKLFRPFDNLIKGVEEIKFGIYDKKIKESGVGEVKLLAGSINNMAEEINKRENSLRKATSELADRMAELQESQEQLVRSEKLATLGELAGGITHEIKNPLGAIITSTQLLKLDTEDLIKNLKSENELHIIKSMKEEIEIVELASKQAKDILANMLDYTRIESSENAKLDLKNVIDSSVMLVKKELMHAKVNIVLDVEKDLFMNGKAGELTQVLLNFILNSRDAILEKKVLPGTVKIKAYKAKGKIILHIEDDGIGISEENKSKIFEAFFTTKDKGKGTGLGMSITNNILKKYNANLTLESKVGEGTKFTVIFDAV